MTARPLPSAASPIPRVTQEGLARLVQQTLLSVIHCAASMRLHLGGLSVLTRSKPDKSAALAGGTENSRRQRIFSCQTRSCMAESTFVNLAACS